MKVLLRRFDNEQYVLKRATYNNGKFIVDGDVVRLSNIVSVINDNRHNYLQCSSCGEVFKKDRTDKFEKHREMAGTPKPCLKCPYFHRQPTDKRVSKTTINSDGTYVEKVHITGIATCKYFNSWSSYSVMSDFVLHECNKRKCRFAELVEIEDIFTKYPGVFDDIITVDALIDAGYHVKMRHDLEQDVYLMEDFYASVNEIGVVDKFVINCGWDSDIYLYYSSKYDMFFDSKYREYKDNHLANFENMAKIVKKLYGGK